MRFSLCGRAIERLSMTRALLLLAGLAHLPLELRKDFAMSFAFFFCVMRKMLG